jgi:hypothetical protein
MLISKTASVTIVGRNKEFYKKLGYEIPERFLKSEWAYTTPRGTKIEVKVSDLQAGSRALVNVKCDFCGKIIEKKYYKYLQGKDNGDACEKCKTKKAGQALLKKYGANNSFAIPEIREKGDRKKRVPFEIIEQECVSKGYNLIALSYSKTGARLEYICQFHPLISQSILLGDFRRGHGCRWCGRERYSGDRCHTWAGGVTDIQAYLRKKLKPLVLARICRANHICELTGKKYRILQLHHIDGFNKLLLTTLGTLNFTIKTIGNYSEEELTAIKDEFIQQHELCESVILGDNVHKKFHHIYGFKHFTANDYYEFALLVKKGELDV